MKRKCKFSQDRNALRLHRAYRCTILKIHANTRSYRAFLADYHRWMRTREYNDLTQEIEALSAKGDPGRK